MCFWTKDAIASTGSVMMVEAAVATLAAPRIQFERTGYFGADTREAAAAKPSSTASWGCGTSHGK